MSKTKYIFQRILKLDYKNFFAKINLIHKETKKSKIAIFFDMIFTCLKYQAGYMDYYLLKMYNMNAKEKATFLVRGENNYLINLLNKKEDIHLLNNKIETNNLYHKYLKRDWSYVANKNVSDFIKKHKKFIAKPSDGQCGKGIKMIETKYYKSIEDVIKYLKKNSLDLLEELVVQNNEINQINKSSVNTLRIVTIYNKKVYYIGACFRIGNNNFVDNFESGGMTARVDIDSGLVIGPAIDKKGKAYYSHPVTKKRIVDFKIPYYKEALKMIEQMVKVIPTVRYVGWDIAITNDGPVLIEANPLPGSQITQMPYPGYKKEGCLPRIKEAVMDLKEKK